MNESSGRTERIARRLTGGDVADPNEPPQHGLSGDRIGREVGVAKDEIVAMAMARNA